MDDEDVYEYTAYGYDEEYGINVAGGGLGNGNACAYVKEKNNEYWYYEYGKYPTSWKIGSEIDWDEEGYSFNILS